MYLFDVSILRRYHQGELSDDEQQSASSHAYSAFGASSEGVDEPFVGTDQMSNEQLQKHLDGIAEREAIKRQFVVQQERGQIEQNQGKRDAENAFQNQQQQRQLQLDQDAYNARMQRKEQDAKVAQQEIERQHIKLQQQSDALSLKEREHQLIVAKRKERDASRWQTVRHVFKTIFLTMFTLLLAVVLSTAGWWMWRWAFESPIIEEVLTEVEVEVEKQVIPPECTQIRRNGQVYISCDGVTVDGVSTISESGQEIPELLMEP